MKHGISTALYNNGRLSLSHLPDLQSAVHEHTSCIVGWTTGTQGSWRIAQHIYSCRLQYRYGYEQHTIAPPADIAFTQAPVALPEEYPWTE